MPKRMIDTDLWNDEDIISAFTAEDKYFWLYLLTNPHNNICGVLKNSPALIARDMGLHKDTIVNLLYRFENVHGVIFVDKETNEIMILNWSKYNWTKSDDFLKTIEKNLKSVVSEKIKELLIERVNEKSDKTVLRPSQEGTNTISITVNYSYFVDIYNNTCTNLPKVSKLTEDRKRNIKKFLSVYSQDDFDDVCKKANETSFLIGSNGKWKADFDFIIRVDKATKILEGCYGENQTSESSFDVDEFFAAAMERTYGGKI